MTQRSDFVSFAHVASDGVSRDGHPGFAGNKRLGDVQMAARRIFVGTIRQRALAPPPARHLR
jgi:hypothetical protein